MSVYTVLYSIAHLVIIVNKSYFNQINIYITYLLQLFLEVFELTQLTGQTGGQTCDISMTECKLFLIVTYKIYSGLVKSVRGWDVNAVTIYE